MKNSNWLAAAAFAGLAGCGMMSAEGESEVVVAEVEDGCGAAGLEGLVGTSVGTLDPSTLPEPRRIIFPGQAVTMDFLPDRLNVEIGEDDLVQRVYCG